MLILLLWIEFGLWIKLIRKPSMDQQRINLIGCWVKLWIGKSGKNLNVGEDELQEISEDEMELKR